MLLTITALTVAIFLPFDVEAKKGGGRPRTIRHPSGTIRNGKPKGKAGHHPSGTIRMKRGGGGKPRTWRR